MINFLLAFSLFFLAFIFLTLSFWIKGKMSYRCGSCGKDPNGKKGCGLCGKESDEEKKS